MSTTETVSASRPARNKLFKEYVTQDRILSSHLRNSREAREAGHHENAGFFAAAAAVVRANLLDLHIKLRKSEKALNGDS